MKIIFSYIVLLAVLSCNNDSDNVSPGGDTLNQSPNPRMPDNVPSNDTSSYQRMPDHIPDSVQ